MTPARTFPRKPAHYPARFPDTPNSWWIALLTALTVGGGIVGAAYSFLSTAHSP